MRVIVAILGLLLCAADALAGSAPVLANPSVSPNPATTSEDVVYTAAWDGCGALRPPSIVVTNNLIQITQPVDVICGVPPGPLGVLYRLGPFQPGTYRVHVVPCAIVPPDQCIPGTLPEDVIFRVVGGVAALSAPTMGFPAGVLLVASIVLLAARKECRQRGRARRTS